MYCAVACCDTRPTQTHSCTDTHLSFQDKDPRKINLGVGAYRDDDGKPFVLKCVREAEKRIFEQKFNHEYLPIVGLQDFNTEAAKLIFGPDSAVLKKKLVWCCGIHCWLVGWLVVQSITSTGVNCNSDRSIDQTQPIHPSTSLG
jgi:hypothetical protein